MAVLATAIGRLSRTPCSFSYPYRPALCRAEGAVRVVIRPNIKKYAATYRFAIRPSLFWSQQGSSTRSSTRQTKLPAFAPAMSVKPLSPGDEVEDSFAGLP
eukprot:scaffold74896_cov25-Prasinocladus_malaysianus.AAC.2